MNAKIALLILFGLGAVTIIGALRSNSAFSQQSPSTQHPSPDRQTWKNPKWEDPTTLKARTKPVKNKGGRKAILPGPVVEYEFVKGLDQALAAYSVVVAELVGKQSYVADSHSIGTVYRFRIVDTLSRKEPINCCGLSSADIPSGLPPLGENEVYILGGGGTVMIDDIEVTVEEEYGKLSKGQKYLLYLTFGASGGLARVQLGPWGIFKVKNDLLEPFTEGDHPLKRDIEQVHGNSISSVKSKIKRRQNLK